MSARCSRAMRSSRCVAAQRGQSRRARPDARRDRRRTRKCSRSLSRASSSLWKAARRRVCAQNRRDALVVGDEQRAGRGAHEDLYARGARQALQFGNVLGVLMRAADPEGEVAMHAPGRRARPCRRVGGGRGRQRLGVRHFEHARHAAEHGGARAGLQIFLMRRAGLAKMHLRVDDAGENVQPRAIDPLAGVRARQIADFGDLAAGDADVARPFPS